MKIIEEKKVILYTDIFVLSRMKASSIEHKIEDTKQSFWHLTAIQVVLMTNLPMLSVCILLMEEYGLLNAAITLILGNFILLGIRVGLISTCKGTRENTLDVARRYVGYVGGFVIAIFMLASLIGWFVEQTTIASNVLFMLIPINEGPLIDPYIQWSIYMGVLSTFLCMQGIAWVRWVSIVAFPVIIACIILSVILTPDVQLMQFTRHKFSLAGLPMMVGASLGVSADLPTFFRHSASWKDSKKAIFLIQSFSLLIGLLGLYLVSVISPSSSTLLQSGMHSTSLALKTTLIILVIFSATTANIASIYAASVAWELVAPVLSGKKEYLMLGLVLTSIFILVVGSYSLSPLTQIAEFGLINLCLILITGYFFIKKNSKEPERFDRWALFLAWFLATMINICVYLFNIPLPVMSLILALVVISFMLFIVYGLRWVVRSVF